MIGMGNTLNLNDISLKQLLDLFKKDDCGLRSQKLAERKSGETLIGPFESDSEVQDELNQLLIRVAREID